MWVNVKQLKSEYIRYTQTRAHAQGRTLWLSQPKGQVQAMTETFSDIFHEDVLFGTIQ